MSGCRVPMPVFRRDDMKEARSFHVETVPTKVRAECPHCGEEVVEDYGAFEETALWHGEETMGCPACGREFRLCGPETD